MPHKTKAQRAAYMRRWRERQQADLAARATRPSSQDPRKYEPGPAGRGEVPTPLVEDNAPMTVSPLPPMPDKVSISIQTVPDPKVQIESTSVGDTHTVPSFLAAPVDECPACGHDRQESDHLGGRPCKFKFGRRACGCMFEGF